VCIGICGWDLWTGRVMKKNRPHGYLSRLTCCGDSVCCLRILGWKIQYNLGGLYCNFQSKKIGQLDWNFRLFPGGAASEETAGAGAWHHPVSLPPTTGRKAIELDSSLHPVFRISGIRFHMVVQKYGSISDAPGLMDRAGCCLEIRLSVRLLFLYQKVLKQSWGCP